MSLFNSKKSKPTHQDVMPEKVARAEIVEIEKCKPEGARRITNTPQRQKAPHDEEFSELCEAMIFDNQIVE